MNDGILVVKERGNKKVKIVDDGYGIEFFTMRNGWLWSEIEADDELLHLMKSALEEYFDMVNKQKKSDNK